MSEKLNIFSAFDGIACGYNALLDAGFEIDNYYASEIDTAAIKVAKYNHPDIKEIGDITDIDFGNYSTDIDILLGGSPCIDLSRCGKREGLYGKYSSLFWYFVDALKIIKPKYFLFENVASMEDIDKNIISKALGVKPIMIDSALLSAQHRERYYWTNIPNVEPPEHTHVYMKDIIARDYESEEDKVHFLNRAVDWIPEDKIKRKELMPIRIGTLSGLSHAQSNRVYSLEGKSVSIVANSGGSGGKTGLWKIDTEDGYILRKLLPVECERLQTLPDNYTLVNGVSTTQRYKLINNGWTVKIISHILKNLKGVV